VDEEKGCGPKVKREDTKGRGGVAVKEGRKKNCKLSFEGMEYLEKGNTPVGSDRIIEH